MIDWVSIVRNSGHRFSSIIGSGVPLKVRRKRRKRIVAQEQQQQEQLFQKLKTVQELQKSVGNSGAALSAASCTCEQLKDYSGDFGRVEDDEVGSCSGASASISVASSTGNYLSTSPGCSSLPGTTYGGASVNCGGNAIFVTGLHGPLSARRASCDVHGNRRVFVVVSRFL